jgi:asparagine synthase (glutamine-hydrolysing)
MADVPVASLLSGGVDSSLVTLFMSRHLPYTPTAFGIGFASDGERSEFEAAALAARDLGVDFDGELVRDDAYVEVLPQALVRLGDPLANTGGFLIQMLCAKARGNHKVVLTGQGADEPLGGYPRHAAERLHTVARLAPGPSAAVTRFLLGSDSGDRLRRIAASRDRIDRYVEILSVVPRDQVDLLVPNGSASCDELARTAVQRWVSADETADSLNELLQVDARMSLADDLLLVADHFSMSESVELRVPFLDLRFLELVERMPSRYKLSSIGSRKWLYRNMAARNLPAPLGRRVCGIRARVGRKRGFSTPHDVWFGSSDSPLGKTESWVRALDRVPTISQNGVATLLKGEGNQRGIRQRAALYALAAWAERML